jgi:aromatic-L-amino-acid decarboxylase
MTRPAGRSGPPATLEDLDPAQLGDLGDMSPGQFRAAAHATVDLLADYLEHLEDFAVLPRIQPGALRDMLPAAPPEGPEPIGSILADVSRLVAPNATHWQHPGFLAYFATTASGPGILGEFVTAVLGQNPMLWRTSPIGTELEEVVVAWLRQAVGLPDSFDGLLTDTASTSSLIAIAAAREAGGLDAAARGLAGRPSLGPPVVYASEEAHSSIEKACMTLGLGREACRRIPVDGEYAMRTDALEAAVAADRASGRTPIAIVATIGTTSSTAVDPVAAIAEIAARQSIWLHVDAAYGGAAALLPDRRDLFVGWERADSIVVNPHKWFFTPLDASLLLSRQMPTIRTAFSLVPEYLRTLDRDRPFRDFSEYQPQLGRRMRAVKLWFLVRYFGVDGLRRRIEAHCQMARRLSAEVDAHPDFERLAPVPFSTVCLRWRPSELIGSEHDPEVRARLEAANERLMAAVNATGEVFLSHTRLGNRFAIRIAIGNLRTEPRHVGRAWALLQEEAARLAR